VAYVRDRPTAWRSGFISFQIYTINTERNSFSAGFWLRHKLPFQSSSIVHGDAGRFMLFLAKTLQRLGLRYTLPTQPVQIHAGIADNAWRQFHDAEEPPKRGSHRGDASDANDHGFAGMTELLNKAGASHMKTQATATPSAECGESAPGSANLEQQYAAALERLKAVEAAAKEWQDIVLGDVSRLWRTNLRKFTGDSVVGAASATSAPAADAPSLAELLQSAAAAGAETALAAMRQQEAGQRSAGGAGTAMPAATDTASGMYRSIGSARGQRVVPAAPHRWESHQRTGSTAAASLPLGLEDLPVFGPSNFVPGGAPPVAPPPQKHGLDVHNRVKQFGGFDFRPTAQPAVPPPSVPKPVAGAGGGHHVPRLTRSASWSRGDRMGIVEGGVIASGIKISTLSPATPVTATQPGGGFKFGRGARGSKQQKRAKAHEV